VELASLVRPAALIAGPAAVLSSVLLGVGLVVHGERELLTSPLLVASFALLLGAVFGLSAAALAALVRLHGAGRGVAGGAIAVVGTMLVAGGTWTSLFVQPALAEHAPEVLAGDLAGVIVGYIGSYVVFSVGWVWTAVALVRARLLPTAVGAVLAVGGALAFVPGPSAFRLLTVSIAASMVASRLTTPTPRDHGAVTTAEPTSVVTAP